jgi:single-strand DNA-binding protein
MKTLRNKVNLIGNLGVTPEIRTLEGGSKKASVTIATNESYKNAKGEKVTETQWHNLVAWGRNADLLEKYTKAGSRIAVEGRLVNRQWTDKTGQKRYTTEVVVNEIMLLGTINKD